MEYGAYMKIIFVVGLYKSGTSIITQLIETMGFQNFDDLWDDSVKGVNNDYMTLESASVNKLNDKIFGMHFSRLYRLSPLWLYKMRKTRILRNKEVIESIIQAVNSQEKPSLVIKDPRFCLTLPIWVASLRDKMPLKIIFVVRNRKNIIKSWLKDEWCRKFLKIETPNQALIRCEQYESYLIKQYLDLVTEFDCHLIDFEKLKSETELQIKSLANFLNYKGELKSIGELVKK
jgi:hypothetical protein